MFLKCRSSAFLLGPWLSPAKILQKQIYEYGILLIQDYTYSRLKHYTYSLYSKSYLEMSSYDGVQINGKAFHYSTVFSSITKEMEKTLW